MILQGRFCGKVRSGYKGVRIVSMLRLKSPRRCTTGCFAIARERALLRFVNCWSMTGAFRRRPLRSGPRCDCGPNFRSISRVPCITRSAAERDGGQDPVLRHPSDRRGTGRLVSGSTGQRRARVPWSAVWTGRGETRAISRESAPSGLSRGLTCEAFCPRVTVRGCSSPESMAR